MYAVFQSDTMKRHNANIAKAKTNERKGVKGGDCNRTQCQAPGASSYNRATRAYYCEHCADLLNDSARRHNEEEFVDKQPDYTFDYEPVATNAEEPSNGDTAKPSFGRKVGRNEPCPCGSGNKFKKCCGG